MFENRSLTFLRRASNDDLLVLCDIVTKEKDGTFRTTETLSSTRSYHRNYPDNIKKILPALIHEFRLFGGNSLLNFFRDEGPEYSEILRDVVCRCNVLVNNAIPSDEFVEQSFLNQLLKKTLDDCSNRELKQIMRELNLTICQFKREQAILILKSEWERRSDQGFLLMASVVSNILSQLTNQVTKPMTGLTQLQLASIILGPATWLISLLACVLGTAGPAYSVTIPAVILIAYIRQKVKYNFKN